VSSVSFVQRESSHSLIEGTETVSKASFDIETVTETETGTEEEVVGTEARETEQGVPGVTSTDDPEGQEGKSSNSTSRTVRQSISVLWLFW
jgi:hypothetical protein